MMKIIRILSCYDCPYFTRKVVTQENEMNDVIVVEYPYCKKYDTSINHLLNMTNNCELPELNDIKLNQAKNKDK
jgi:hypothetical protein